MKPRTPDRNRTCNLVLTRDLRYLLCYESISQDGGFVCGIEPLDFFRIEIVYLKHIRMYC